MDNEGEPRLTHSEGIAIGFAATPIVALLTHYFILLNAIYPLGLAIFGDEGLTLGWLAATFAPVLLFC